MGGVWIAITIDCSTPFHFTPNLTSRATLALISRISFRRGYTRPKGGREEGAYERHSFPIQSYNIYLLSRGPWN